MSRFMGHYQSGQICAVYLRGDRQDWEEVKLLNALEGCAALLVIGINDPRRHQTLVEVPYYTAVDRNTVPIHVRKSGMTWLTVLDRTTREPLNGSRRIPWSPAIVRDGFDVPDEIDAELAQ